MQLMKYKMNAKHFHLKQKMNFLKYTFVLIFCNFYFVSACDYSYAFNGTSCIGNQLYASLLNGLFH